MIEISIPGDVPEVQLYLQDGAIEDRYTLKLGTIDPIDSQSGDTQRLLNLGYPARRNLEEAILAFQHAGGLREMGAMDEQTQKSLRETYGL